MELTNDIKPIENKITESGLITIDLEEFYHKGERILFDIKDQLYRGMILREKEFRDFIISHNWSQYQNKNIAFTCTADAIIPTWAYMLLAVNIEPFTNRYIFGDLETLETILFNDALQQIDAEKYKDARVIIKGCGDIQIPISAYVEITHKLSPYVKSLMFGEACSNVPIYKKK